MAQSQRSNSAAIPHPSFRPLDPVENICTGKLKPGHYSRQYRAHATAGVWGRSEARTGALCRCGASVLVDQSSGAVRVMPVLCDMWSCKLCGVKRAAWFKRELGSAQLRYALGHFWTLTLSHDNCTAAESSQYLQASWHRLLRVLGKPGPLAYVWVEESTKAGWQHLHLLADREMTPGALSAAWRTASRGSFIVDAEPVESSRAADYLAKYCTQQATARQAAGMEHLRGRRMFSKSQGIKFEPFRAPGRRVDVLDEGTGELVDMSTWQRVDTPYWNYVEGLKKGGMVPIVERVQGTPFVEFR